jgi:hypothetical protein
VGHYERLSALDASFLEIERSGRSPRKATRRNRTGDLLITKRIEGFLARSPQVG